MGATGMAAALWQAPIFARGNAVEKRKRQINVVLMIRHYVPQYGSRNAMRVVYKGVK